MRLVDLLGTRFGSGDDECPVYEGPIAGVRGSLNVAAACNAIRRIENELAGQRGTRLRVGILSNHQVETYVSVLASITGQHTFVPLNPKFPHSRLEQILALGSVDVILHDEDTANVLTGLSTTLRTINVTEVISKPTSPDERAEVATWRAALGDQSINGDEVVYIMFTSGSTGTPKGVPVSFSSLVHYVQGITDLVQMERGLRYTQFFDLSFDLSIHDIFVSNYLWGTLVAPSKIDLMMPSGYISREKITAWFSVPILGAQLGRAPRNPGFRGLRHILFCGEALPMETVVACRSWLSEGGDLWNLYGPTEATIAFMGAKVTASDRASGSASIGQPFGQNNIALAVDGVVKHDLEDGLEGELLLGGPQVFSGYSTDAETPFLDDDNTRWYRSGDLVRLDHEGVYFRGRHDSQVKYRGYRIELGEIEAAARQTYGLTTVAVLLMGEQNDAKIVMFYLESELDDRPDHELDPSELNDLIPAYMVPGSFIGLSTVPTNSNGKIDRKALAAREH